MFGNDSSEGQPSSGQELGGQPDPGSADGGHRLSLTDDGDLRESGGAAASGDSGASIRSRGASLLSEQGAAGSLSISSLAASRGQLRVSGDVRIDGVYEGHLETAGRVIISEQARVLANVAAHDVCVAGAVKGDVSARRVEIMKTGKVWGNVTTVSFVLHHDGFVSGQVTMETEDGPRILQDVGPQPSVSQLAEEVGAGLAEPATAPSEALPTPVGSLDAVPQAAPESPIPPEAGMTPVGASETQAWPPPSDASTETSPVSVRTFRREHAGETRWRRWPWAAGVAALLLAVGSAAALWAVNRWRAPGPVGQDRPILVVQASNDVQARSGPNSPWAAVEAEGNLSSGSALLTGPEGSALLAMDQAEIVVGPNSLVQVLESNETLAGGSAPSRRVARFSVEKGRVWLQTLDLGSNDLLEIEWASGVVRPVAARCTMYVEPGTGALLSVDSGSAVWRGAGRQVVVTSGLQLQLPSGESPSAGLITPMSEQERALWDQAPFEQLLAQAGPTATMLPQATSRPTSAPTARPAASSTPLPTATPSPQPAATATARPTTAPTHTATSTPSPSATQTATLVPSSTPTPTAPTSTPTSLPTETPTGTSLPTDTPSPAPTTSSTPTAETLPPTPAGQAFVLSDFETSELWAPGGTSPGTLQQSTEQVHDGQYAAKLTYDFPQVSNEFAVFWHTVLVQGQPDAFTAWVYGDGSGHHLYVWFIDSQDQGWQTDFGRLDFVGWQQLTAWIVPGRGLVWTPQLGGTDNGVVDYPIRFRGLVIDDAPNDAIGGGAIYIDQLAATEGTPP